MSDRRRAHARQPSGRTVGRRRDGRTKPRPGVDEQRRLIVDQAIQLFSTSNARNVSILEICRAADISRPTFYRCFDDKHALLAYVYELSVDRYVEHIILDELPRDGDVERWIGQAVDRVVDAVFEQPHVAQFVFVEYGDPASPVRHIVNDAFARSAEVLDASLREFYGDAPSPLYLTALMASVQWILFETLRSGLDDESRARAKLAVWQAAISAFRFVSARLPLAPARPA